MGGPRELDPRKNNHPPNASPPPSSGPPPPPADASHDEEGTLQRLEEHLGELIEPRIAAHRGRIVKTHRRRPPGRVRQRGRGGALRHRDPVRHGRPQPRRARRQRASNSASASISATSSSRTEDIYGDGVNIAARLEGWPSRAPSSSPAPCAIRCATSSRSRWRIWASNRSRTSPAGARSSASGAGRPRRSGIAAAAAGQALDRRAAVRQHERRCRAGVFQRRHDRGPDHRPLAGLGLFVIARNSSFAYKGKAVKVQEIGRELGVRFVLEGSIRKAGNRVRITASSSMPGAAGISGPTGSIASSTDIFATQDEVVEKIVERAGGQADAAARSGGCAAAAPSNVEAYEAWLRARELLGRGTRETIAQARAMHRRASRSTRISAPHAGLAFAAVADYVNAWTADPQHALDEAERWARRAIELDDPGAGRPLALGNVLLWQRNHDGALAELRRAIELDPTLPRATRDWHGADVLGPARPRRWSRSRRRCGSTPLSQHAAAPPGAGAFQPGQDYEIAAQPPGRAHRPQSRHRRQPHAAGSLVRPSRPRGGGDGCLGGASQGQSRLLADAARASCPTRTLGISSAS